MCNSGCLDYSENPNILPKDAEGEEFAEETEKCEIPGNLLDRDVEKLDDHGCPKIRDLVDEEMWIGSSYPIRHKTTYHCAECKAKLLGDWTVQH